MNTHYIVVNSSDRQKFDTVDIKENINLEENPLSIINNNLHVATESLNVEVGDMFLLHGLTEKKVTLKMTQNSQDVQFLGNYVKFNVPPQTNQTNEDLYVIVSGFASVTNYIGNVPINYLNKKHKILLSKPADDFFPLMSGENMFFIELEYPFIGNYDPNGDYISLTFLYYKDINISDISSDFKTNIFTIQAKYDTYVTAKINDTHKYSDNMNFGGKYVSMSIVSFINHGYPNPNFYKIPLTKTLHKVTTISLLDTNFPGITSNINSKFNRLYWQNLDDGDVVYSISIPQRLYTKESLASQLHDSMLEIPRITDINTFFNSKNIFYFNFENDVTSVESYREAVISQPIIEVTNIYQGKYIIKFRQNNNNIKKNMKIMIKNCVGHGALNSEYINGLHIVTDSAEDNFSILISNVNDSSNNQSFGGNNVSFFAPNKFRFRFDYDDSVNILGFSNIGNKKSITGYNNIVTSKDPYEDEGNATTNNNLNLDGNKYTLVTFNNFNLIATTCPLNFCFAKINLDNKKYYFDNAFISNYENLHGCQDITCLEFAFYDESGKPFDFNYKDHSFVLKITTK